MESKTVKDKPFKSKKEYGSVKRSKPVASKVVAEVGFGLRVRRWIDNCLNKISG